MALALAGCATSGGPVTGEPDRGKPASAVVDPPVIPGAPTLFVAMPMAPDFVAARHGLVSEVQKTFNVITFRVDESTRHEDLSAALARANPVCVVLMNNSAVELYRRHEAAHPSARRLPTVVVMTLFLEETRSQLARATGIAYEVPGVTAFVSLRAVIDSPVERVGVVYRPVFARFIARQQVLAAKEHVQLIAVSVPADVSAERLRDTLHKVVNSERVDAVWILNDNALLRGSAFVSTVWRAELADAQVPVIVGVPNLVTPDSPLGTLAVVPDHEALGLQTANLIFDLADSGWDVSTHPIELPLSVKTIVDVRSAKASFGLRSGARSLIDRALE